MENLVEFDTIAFYVGKETEDLVKKYEGMGIELPKEAMEGKEEIIVKYNFDCSFITEIRETFVTFRGEKLNGIVATFGEQYIYTPVLLTTMEEFKNKVNECYKKKS